LKHGDFRLAKHQGKHEMLYHTKATL